MPVTTRGATVVVKKAPVQAELSPIDILKGSCPHQSQQGSRILASSFSDKQFVRASRNGFVRTAIDAYLQHNHLTLRPDDLWFAILTQFSFYVNGHAEELRHFFVEHKGKKKLQILQDGDLDLRQFAKDMTGLIAQNIKDPSLREWIVPAFTTTTHEDKVVASILMMGMMKKYFAYCGGVTCGIPSVTLLGEKKDWEEILRRIEFLREIPDPPPTVLGFSTDMQDWYSHLKSIVSNFVLTFDAPDSDHVVDFWSRTIHQYEDDCSGEKWITGWINVFCFWDANGKPLSARLIKEAEPLPASHAQWKGDQYAACAGTYGQLDTLDIPSGFVHVPVHFKIASEKFVVTMIAGSLGWRILDSRDIFAQTREKCRVAGPRRSSRSSQLTLADSTNGKDDVKGKSRSKRTEGSSSVKSGQPQTRIIRSLVRRLLCFPSAPQAPEPSNSINLSSVPARSFQVPYSVSSQLPDNNYFDKSDRLPKDFDPSAWELGGTGDMLQPVTGWIGVVNETVKYGKDEDQPDMVIDSDDENYDAAVEGKGSMSSKNWAKR